MIRINTEALGEVCVTFSHVRNEDTITKKVVNGRKKARAELDTYTQCDISWVEQPKYFYQGDQKFLTDIPKEKSVFGIAVLHPLDTFNADKGRETALFRALDQIVKLSNRTRREILKGYFSRMDG